MARNEKDLASQIGQALGGASRVMPIPNLPGAGPLDLMQLRAEVASGLHSTGGRPSEPRWNVQRLVPFEDERWHELEELAAKLSAGGRKVSPGQLAAILLERALKQIDKAT